MKQCKPIKQSNLFECLLRNSKSAPSFHYMWSFHVILSPDTQDYCHSKWKCWHHPTLLSEMCGVTVNICAAITGATSTSSWVHSPSEPWRLRRNILERLWNRHVFHAPYPPRNLPCFPVAFRLCCWTHECWWGIVSRRNVDCFLNN